MHDELTAVDIQKMKEEMDYRIRVLRPQLIEEVQTTRAFGDLSENFEYKCAKQAKNKNDSRIRYLDRMIRTAKVIVPESEENVVGLFDTVSYYVEEDDCEETVRIATSLRRDPFQSIISKESPLGIHSASCPIVSVQCHTPHLTPAIILSNNSIRTDNHYLLQESQRMSLPVHL